MKAPKNKNLDRILEEIAAAQTICVVGHVRPDGDCIGSQLGLSLALLGAGKEVTCWNQDVVPDKLRFLDPKKVVQQPKPGKEFDLVIATDAASYERLGVTGTCINKRKRLVNIDHHESNTQYGDVNWIEPRKPSTGELIYELIKAAKWKVTPAISDCLFTAVSTDTGSFQYPSTTPATYRVAGELVEEGANLAKICNEVYQSYPLGRVRLLRHMYNKFRLTDENQIAYFWLKQKDYARTGSSVDDSEGLIDHIRAIEPVVVACLFEEVNPELTRISLRSKDPRVNVNEVAAEFGGGGHPAAAGARIPGTPMSAQRKVIAALRRALKEMRKTPAAIGAK